jgi:hypothetical protein
MAYLADKDGVRHHLGRTPDLAEAIRWRKEAELAEGYSENHGKPANFAVELGLHQPKGNIL